MAAHCDTVRAERRSRACGVIRSNAVKARYLGGHHYVGTEMICISRSMTGMRKSNRGMLCFAIYLSRMKSQEQKRAHYLPGNCVCGNTNYCFCYRHAWYAKKG